MSSAIAKAPSAKAGATGTAIAPIHASVEVPAPQAKAFAVVTGRMTGWWPAEYALVLKPRQEATRKGLLEQGGWGDLVKGFAMTATAQG
jgi:hypothetical protein